MNFTGDALEWLYTLGIKNSIDVSKVIDLILDAYGDVAMGFSDESKVELLVGMLEDGIWSGELPSLGMTFPYETKVKVVEMARSKYSRL